MCVFSLLGNFECGNPEKLKSKCIPVTEAQEYLAVSRLGARPSSGGPGAFVLVFQTPHVAFCFPFHFVLGFLAFLLSPIFFLLT